MRDPVWWLWVAATILFYLIIGGLVYRLVGKP